MLQCCLTSTFDLVGSFKLYDINCDGFISKDEMSAIVDSLYRMVVSYVLLQIIIIVKTVYFYVFLT